MQHLHSSPGIRPRAVLAPPRQAQLQASLTACSEVPPADIEERAFFFKSSDLELGSIMLVSVSGLDEENLLDAVRSFQGSV